MRHSAIDNTAHSRPLNSLEQCICTASMKNIQYLSVSSDNRIECAIRPASVHWASDVVWKLNERHVTIDVHSMFIEWRVTVYYYHVIEWILLN